ncbi:MAG: STAS domain-containing protein [Actinocatenispora sp.]
MSMTIRKESGCPVVELVGEIDLGSATSLRAVLYDAATSAPVVVADLSRASATDARGIGALVLIAHIAHRLGGQIRIAGASPTLRAMIDLLGAAQRPSMFPTVATAIAGHGPRVPRRRVGTPVAVVGGDGAAAGVTIDVVLAGTVLLDNANAVGMGTGTAPIP